MNLESLTGKSTEMRPMHRDRGTAGFDPDKRMDVKKDRVFSQRSDEFFDPDKRMGILIYYYDDNGKCYREGNELTPNCSYEINGYRYQTDDKGRIISAEGILHQKDHEGRLPIKDSIEDIGKGDQKEGDDRGHLIGDQFGGSNGLENMVPQDAKINRTDLKNLENELAKEVKNGKKVNYEVELIYEGDSRRPSTIIVSYSINDETSVRVFPNGKGN